jgi:hypothetical protein
MATRSRIAIEDEDGTIKSIYCHWDGYLEHNGVILLENYQNREKVEQLIALGNISILDKNIEGDESVIAYHRDYGEKLQFTTFKNVEELLDTEDGVSYIYIFTKTNVWLVNKVGYNLVENLETAIEEG